MDVKSTNQSRVTHIVLFRYSKLISWVDLEQHFSDFAKLQSTCVKPARIGKPYMLSMQMGKNVSWENFAKGMTHAFVLEFASVEDKDFYLLEDPVHHAFSAKAKDLIEDSVVVDIVNGSVFTLPNRGVSTARDAYRGSCYCEQVRFQINTSTGNPPTHIICHCAVCRKISGAPFTCNYVCPIEDFEILEGRHKLGVFEYLGASGKTVSCHYCSSCTSHVYHVQQADPSKAIVRTLLLDCGSKMGISQEIFADNALGWTRNLRGALSSLG